ncbi:hypothetical protein ACQKEI_00995 [Psychrobacter namhaensis]|uniref:hypothetical protein n=1 Tax=Psychrobacter namhaensis TaxID=292734 RepID=UPI003D01AB9B
MSAGLSIIGETGNVQIDSGYSNMIVKDKFRKTGNGLFNVDGLFHAIQPDVGDVWTGDEYPKTDEEADRRQIVENECTPFGHDAGSSLGNMTVYTFDAPTASDINSSNGLGLEVYKADGTVVYNSNLKYLRVLDSSKNYIGQGEKKTDVIPGVSYHEGYVRTLNFGHPNVAVIFNSAYYTLVADWIGIYSLVSSCRLTPDYDLIISDFIGLGDTSSNIPLSTECSWLVIDTTGY